MYAMFWGVLYPRGLLFLAFILGWRTALESRESRKAVDIVERLYLFGFQFASSFINMLWLLSARVS